MPRKNNSQLINSRSQKRLNCADVLKGVDRQTDNLISDLDIAYPTSHLLQKIRGNFLLAVASGVRITFEEGGNSCDLAAMPALDGIGCALYFNGAYSTLYKTAGELYLTSKKGADVEVLVFQPSFKGFLITQGGLMKMFSWQSLAEFNM